MKIVKQLLFFPLVCVALFSSCAKEVEESSESVQRRIIESYIRVNYGDDLKPTESGMYIIHEKIGTGVSLKDSVYPFVRFSKVSLAGDYISSTYDSVAVQLGEYSEDNYYGPRIWRLGNGTVSPGVEELLFSMKVGGKARGIIPPWLLDVETGVEIGGAGSVSIFDMELVGYEEDIYKYQQDSLEWFGDKYFGGVDSTALGFYYKVLDAKPAEDSLENEDKVNLYYVGRYLDGRIFDTNIEDTAKVHKIFEVGNTTKYNAISAVYMSDFEQMLEKEENSYVNGFTKLISLMKYGERAIAFFDSSWGYGAAGSISNNSGIPEFTPLSFEIYLIDNRDDEDDDEEDDSNDD